MYLLPKDNIVYLDYILLDDPNFEVAEKEQ